MISLILIRGPSGLVLLTWDIIKPNEQIIIFLISAIAYILAKSEKHNFLYLEMISDIFNLRFSNNRNPKIAMAKVTNRLSF